MKFEISLVSDKNNSETFKTDDPTEVEFFYFRYSRLRTGSQTRVEIDSKNHTLVPPAKFILNWQWSGFRELSQERQIFWAENATTFTQPTTWQIKALIRAIGLSASEVARRLGVTDRLVRYWIANENEERREIPWTAWTTLLSWLESQDNIKDQGFVEMWLRRFRGVITKAQLRQPYESDLQSVAEEFSAHAAIVIDIDYIGAYKALVSRLNLEATLNETPEPMLPHKLSDKNLNLTGRIAALREAANLVETIAFSRISQLA